MFIVQHHDHDFGTETRDQEPKDDLDSPSGCHKMVSWVWTWLCVV